MRSMKKKIRDIRDEDAHNEHIIQQKADINVKLTLDLFYQICGDGVLLEAPFHLQSKEGRDEELSFVIPSLKVYVVL